MQNSENEVYLLTVVNAKRYGSHARTPVAAFLVAQRQLAFRGRLWKICVATH